MSRPGLSDEKRPYRKPPGFAEQTRCQHVMRASRPKRRYSRLVAALSVAQEVRELPAFVSAIHRVNTTVVLEPKGCAPLSSLEATNRTWGGNFGKHRQLLVHWKLPGIYQFVTEPGSRCTRFSYKYSQIIRTRDQNTP
jgi:hypothetical protein